ncbi:unknown [[Mannheimia] succiniciproducens MBEL55E]|uniref:Uncharacterized protein n=1 Tax=Mannheimia succiniciproducens (strain KCTC 0769BP / MBEL55E) TaxID=221988 RepID=Q65TV9_MANSM|nr:unknown [[Mannheimia] succiniciproducens MBEL55E]
MKTPNMYGMTENMGKCSFKFKLLTENKDFLREKRKDLKSVKCGRKLGNFTKKARIFLRLRASCI